MSRTYLDACAIAGNEGSQIKASLSTAIPHGALNSSVVAAKFLNRAPGERAGEGGLCVPRNRQEADAQRGIFDSDDGPTAARIFDVRPTFAERQLHLPIDDE
jgi:hypothetical protein